MNIIAIKTWRERCNEHPDHDGIVTYEMIQARMQEEIGELRQAIEQAEQAQPVAWVEQIIDDLHALHDSEMIREIDSGDALIRLDAAIAAVEEAEQRYTAPPPRKLWVGLTGDEVNEFAAGCHLGNSVQGAIRKAEATIKEKNT